MFFEDFTVGREFAIPPVTVTGEAIRSFAASYDPLPFHLDADYAANTPFKGLIAPGVLSFMLVWAEFVRMKVLDDGLMAGKSTKIEWFAPVHEGDILSGIARVARATKRNAGSGLIAVGIEIHNQHGVKVLYDTTELVIRTGGNRRLSR